MNENFEIVVPTLFGLESFTAREIRRMGYETTRVEDGHLVFAGDARAVCRANIRLRCGERVLIKIAEFTAVTFDELFEKTKAVDWSQWLPSDCAFPVKGYTLKSTLASMRDCQAIIKKAVVDSLSAHYGISWFEETGAKYQLQFAVFKDRVTLMLDTSGSGLHKRGYRRNANAAPLRETIAAAMVMMSYWKYEYPFADPFCGSGTIPIEAALFKRNIAPGLTRSFAGEELSFLSKELWDDCREEARAESRSLPLEIFAADIDPECVELTAANAIGAGVGDSIQTTLRNAADFSSELSYGTLICNPPYGERLSDKDSCHALYSEIGKAFRTLDNWSCYILAADENFESAYGKKADKKRKLYNGMIKCNIFQYFGERPPVPEKLEKH